MIKELAARVRRIKPSPTMAVAARAEELISAGKDVISLSVGEPDFDTPDFVKEAAIKAIRDGATKYTAVDGTSGLKKAIIHKFEHDNQLKYAPSEILVSCGAKHSLYNLFAVILEEGDEVLIPAPYWVSYPDMVKLMDATPIFIDTGLKEHFKITPAQLEASITSKTRLLVLNSPSNPTGAAYTADELKALANVLLKHPDIWIVSDDIYEHTLWGKNVFSNIVMVCAELKNRTIVVNGVSKAYAMTGWRIGYAAGPANIIAAMKKVQSQSTSNPTSIAQIAAEAALIGDQSYVTLMSKAYHERHDYVLSELKKIQGIQVQPSSGTFYTFPSFEEIIHQSNKVKDDIQLAEYLLLEGNIAAVPGSAFGTPGYLRLSYATSMEKLKTAMYRLHTALEKLSK